MLPCQRSVGHRSYERRFDSFDLGREMRSRRRGLLRCGHVACVKGGNCWRGYEPSRWLWINLGRWRLGAWMAGIAPLQRSVSLLWSINSLHSAEKTPLAFSSNFKAFPTRLKRDFPARLMTVSSV